MSREKPVAPVVDTKPKLFRISKSAVRDFILFMKSVYFTVHFGDMLFSYFLLRDGL